MKLKEKFNLREMASINLPCWRIDQMHRSEISWFFYYSDFTWNQFWTFWSAKNYHFNTFGGCEFWYFGIFCHFQIWNFHKNQYSKPPKLFKWQFLTFWNQPKLITRKIWVAENSLISILWNVNFITCKQIKFSVRNAGHKPTTTLKKKPFFRDRNFSGLFLQP